MSTTAVATAHEAADDQPSIVVTASPARRRSPTGIVLPGVVAALAIPFLAALVVALTQHWYPSSDMALIELRTFDTGGPHTPMLGAYSRLGWNHPGPLSFWLLAAPFRLFASSTAGMLAGAVVLNAVAAGGTIAVARRRGGTVFAVLVTFALLLLVRGTGASYLLQTWNPYLPVLPTAFLLVATWAVIEGDLPLVPVIVAVSCFAWQTHIGFLPVTGLLTAIALVAAAAHLVAEHRRPEAAGPRRARRRGALVAATVVTAAVCLAPLALEQLTHDPGNIRAVVDSFRNPEGPPVGLARAARIGALRLAPTGPWLTGDDPTEVFTGAAAGTAAAWLLVPVAGLAAGLALAGRARSRRSARFVAVTGVTAVAAVVATSRTTGEPFIYLLQWFRPAAALLWAGVAWAAVEAVRARQPAAGAAVPARSRLRWPLPAAVVVVAGLVALSSLTANLGLRLPDRWQSDALASLVGPTVEGARGAATVRIDFQGLCAREIGDGLALQLVERGIEVRVHPLLASGYGPERVGDRADKRLQVVCGAGTRRAVDTSPVPPTATYELVGRTADDEALALQERFRVQLRAAGRPDLADVVDSELLTLLPGEQIRDLGLGAAEVARYNDLMAQRRRSVAVFLLDPPSG